MRSPRRSRARSGCPGASPFQHPPRTSRPVDGVVTPARSAAPLRGDDDRSPSSIEMFGWRGRPPLQRGQGLALAAVHGHVPAAWQVELVRLTIRSSRTRGSRGSGRVHVLASERPDHAHFAPCLGGDVDRLCTRGLDANDATSTAAPRWGSGAEPRRPSASDGHPRALAFVDPPAASTPLFPSSRLPRTCGPDPRSCVRFVGPLATTQAPRGHKSNATASVMEWAMR